MADLIKDVQGATGEHVDVAYVGQGYTSEVPKQDAAQQGVNVIVIKLQEAKRGFALLPKRWRVQRILPVDADKSAGGMPINLPAAGASANGGFPSLQRVRNLPIRLCRRTAKFRDSTSP